MSPNVPGSLAMGLGFTFKKQASVPAKKPIPTDLFKEEDESEKKPIMKPHTEHGTPKVAAILEKESIVQVSDDTIEYEEDKETEASSVLLSRYQKLAESYRKSKIKEENDSVEGPSSKYIMAMKEAAEKRKITLEEARLRKNRREAQSQDSNSKDNEAVFVTSAYRQKLEELKSQGVNVDNRKEDKDDSTLPQRPSSRESFLKNVVKDNVFLNTKRASRSRSPKRD